MMVETTINGRWKIKLPKHRAERPEYHTPPYWEEARLNSMHEHIGAGDVVYYVGAEEGDMAALLAMWGAEMVLFEPNERVWPNIKAIWEANDLVKPSRMFVGFASNETAIDETAMSNADFTNWSWWPSCADGEVIGDHGFKELNDAGDIKQIRIDSFPYPSPTAISIDVEGSEWRVLEGAEETLRKYHPKIWLSIHPEFMFRIYGEYQYDLRRWIKDLGYKETLLDYQHELHLFYEAGND